MQRQNDKAYARPLYEHAAWFTLEVHAGLCVCTALSDRAANIYKLKTMTSVSLNNKYQNDKYVGLSFFTQRLLSALMFVQRQMVGLF
jgi:hypothetical protein